jgi:hypothetical protein
VEVLHAVFHGRLVRAGFVVAALHQGQTAGVHAFADFVVFDGGFHIGRALRLDELGFEGGDFLGVVELDDVQGFLRAARVKRGQRQHMRVDLDHVGGEIGDPQRAEIGRLAGAKFQ